MEYYHWKLYSSQRFERLAFPLLFFNYGWPSSPSTS
jgi:hypothetical protein